MVTPRLVLKFGASQLFRYRRYVRCSLVVALHKEQLEQSQLVWMRRVVLFRSHLRQEHA